jgi:hypothetical protein
MIKLLFQLLCFYLLYKLVVDFIVPVYKTTRQLKSKMSEMQKKMEDQQQAGFQTPKYEAKPADSNKEYIDYEEVR